ncbi:hypothetical protein [Rhizobium sp. 18065]|uniref:hypothetical protein n=1 Tax=Rhizobium sp. 18065 TaxID=2681411 RepID=UPI001358F8F8|nr:hypothetical protein [Rhizobium sp. 18065]
MKVSKFSDAQKAFILRRAMMACQWLRFAARLELARITRERMKAISMARAASGEETEDY